MSRGCGQRTVISARTGLERATGRILPLIITLFVMFVFLAMVGAAAEAIIGNRLPISLAAATAVEVRPMQAAAEGEVNHHCEDRDEGDGWSHDAFLNQRSTGPDEISNPDQETSIRISAVPLSGQSNPGLHCRDQDRLSLSHIGQGLRKPLPGLHCTGDI
jgi:hypothetical protein